MLSLYIPVHYIFIKIMLSVVTVSYNTVTADQVASLRDITILLGHVPVDCLGSKVITMATCIHPSWSCLPPFYTIPIFPL